jgi:two-component system, NarL family, response regulator NreC
VRVRVLLAGGRAEPPELNGAQTEIDVVGHVSSLEHAEEALRALKPSVLVLSADLAHHEGLCSLPSLRRASPETAIVLPPAGAAGPRLVHAIGLAAGGFARRRGKDGLTLREREVVTLVALGHTNREIAERLVLSERTVETHRARIQHRHGFGSRAQLVRWALDQGLVER